MILILLLPWLVGGWLAQPASCPATGALALSPAASRVGESALLVASVDSSDPDCLPIVRSEPFVILRSPAGEQELSLVAEGEQFVGEIVVPPSPWSATLYVVGTGDAVAVVRSAPLTLEELRLYLSRSPGALLIVAVAAALGVAAVVALPVRRRRWRFWQGLVRRRSATAQAVPPTPDLRPEVTPSTLAGVDNLATPTTFGAEVLRPAKGDDIGGDEAADRDEGEDDADRGSAVKGDIRAKGADEGEEHQLARPAQSAPE